MHYGVSLKMLHRTLDEACEADEPLLDIVVKYFDEADPIKATNIFNGLGNDIEVRESPYYEMDCRLGQVTAEGAFRHFGVKYTRVRRGNAGWWIWAGPEIERVPVELVDYVENIGITQPGSNDKGQFYSPLYLK